MDIKDLIIKFDLPPIKWTKEQMHKWLELLNMNDYIKVFEDNKVDGFVIFDIEDDEFEKCLKINNKIHRKRLRNGINILKDFQKYFEPNSEIWTEYKSSVEKNQQEKNKPRLNDHIMPKEVIANNNKIAAATAIDNNGKNEDNGDIKMNEDINNNEINIKDTTVDAQKDILRDIDPNDNEISQPVASKQEHGQENSRRLLRKRQNPNHTSLKISKCMKIHKTNGNKDQNFTSRFLGELDLHTDNDGDLDLNQASNQVKIEEAGFQNINPNQNLIVSNSNYQLLNPSLSPILHHRQEFERVNHELDLVKNPKPNGLTNAHHIETLDANMEIKHPTELLIQPIDGTQANNFYCVNEEGAKIGRHSDNQIILLEESVSRHHSMIEYKQDKFFLIDIGSTTGTFIKIETIKLRAGFILELGSNQFQIDFISNTNKDKGELRLKILEGPNNGNVYHLKDITSIIFGRKNIGGECLIFNDDFHLSNLHAKITYLNGEYLFEDQNSTNGLVLFLHFPLRPIRRFCQSYWELFY